MNFVSIEKQALTLPVQERARLAQRLLEGLDALAEPEAAQLWRDVAIRRAEEIDSGMVRMVSAEELENRVQALLSPREI
jgi:putative addiction module component (TIGR02574 family)